MVGMESREAIVANHTHEQHKIAKNLVHGMHAPQKVLTKMDAILYLPQWHGAFWDDASKDRNGGRALGMHRNEIALSCA